MVNANYLIGGLLKGAGQGGIDRGTDMREARLAEEKQNFVAGQSQVGREFTAGENQKTRDFETAKDSKKTKNEMDIELLKLDQQEKLLAMRHKYALKEGDQKLAGDLLIQQNNITAQKDMLASQLGSKKDLTTMEIASSEKISSLNNEAAADRLASQLDAQKEELKANLDQADYAERNKINLKIMEIDSRKEELNRKINNENWQLQRKLNANRSEGEKNRAASITQSQVGSAGEAVDPAKAYQDNLNVQKGITTYSPDDPASIRHLIPKN